MRILCALFLVLLTSCATSFQDNRFPSKEEVLDLVEKPAPPKKPRDPLATVTEWEMSGPFADRFADRLPAIGAAGEFLEGIAPGRSSEALSCAARELGRFVLKHEKRPEPLLEQFIVGRCGGSARAVGTLSWTGESKDDERALFSRNKEEIVKWMQAAPENARFGIGVARGDADKMTLIVTRAATSASIETTTQIAADNKVQITGAVEGLGPLTAIDAKILKGQLGVENCVREETIAPPRFSFTCPVGDDETTSVAIGAWEKGRVLGHTVAEVVVLPKGGPANVFRRVAHMQPTPLPSSKDAIGGALVGAINEVRKGQNLEPLAHAVAQDKIASALADRYFAELDDDDRTLDLIALGVLAGYEVKEIVIGDGDFNSFLAYGEGLDELMARALASPWLRSMMMRPESKVATVGVTEVGDGYGVLMSTYEPLVTPDTAMATRVFESLRAARRARGVSDLMILPVGDAEKRALIAVHEGQEPMKAMDKALREAVNHRGSSLQGWVVTAQDLERVDWPEELLTPRSTSVAMALGIYKHKNAAWGSLIMFVIAEIDNARVAMSSPAAN